MSNFLLYAMFFISNLFVGTELDTDYKFCSISAVSALCYGE